MVLIEIRDDNFAYYLQARDISNEIGNQNNGRSTHKTGKISDTIVKAGHKCTEAIGKVITGIASDISMEINKSEKKPTEWEIEFGMDVSAEGNIYIITGETTATMKVKMIWKEK